MNDFKSEFYNGNIYMNVREEDVTGEVWKMYPISEQEAREIRQSLALCIIKLHPDTNPVFLEL